MKRCGITNASSTSLRQILRPTVNIASRVLSTRIITSLECVYRYTRFLMGRTISNAEFPIRATSSRRIVNEFWSRNRIDYTESFRRCMSGASGVETLSYYYTKQFLFFICSYSFLCIIYLTLILFIIIWFFTIIYKSLIILNHYFNLYSLLIVFKFFRIYKCNIIRFVIEWTVFKKSIPTFIILYI